MAGTAAVWMPGAPMKAELLAIAMVASVMRSPALARGA